ncbi:OmpA family protein [Alkalicella caledoniensis]|uniref:OmpA family protein n=1 Tax=Alkalicella caledoniensis TaxID=2731377 RepID=A0A7G9WCL3_ALKCA|nr:flagellar motor protein MotB [Alkalicella caledoniensis]QNO16425.1 OmpA family protein [Alkalicella caledoniensis]
MRRRRSKDESVGQDNWLLTYSDVITLVLCMFIMLYSFSTIDAQKFQQLVTSLNQSFSGVLDGGKIISPDELDNIPKEEEPPLDEGEEIDEEFISTYEQILSLINDYGLEDRVFIGIEPKGVEIRFSDGIFFAPGRADIKSSAMELLDKLTGIFQEIDNEIHIEGHTDTIPINTVQFPSNWELSAGRAISVVKHFEEKGIDSQRLGALGFGEYRPIDTNETPQGRQANRRVNIIVLRSSAD